jgi:hypothetical protein
MRACPGIMAALLAREACCKGCVYLSCKTPDIALSKKSSGVLRIAVCVWLGNVLLNNIHLYPSCCLLDVCPCIDLLQSLQREPICNARLS